jgi:hypothetical protein
VEDPQDGCVQFGDEPTKFVIEDASTQALDAGKVLIEAGRELTEAAWHRPMARLLLDLHGLTVEVDDHPQQVGDGILEREEGVALERIACVLPGLLSLDLAGYAFPISEQLHLPQRHAASDNAPNHHADEGQYHLPHRFAPPYPLQVSQCVSRIRPGRNFWVAASTS